MERKRFPIEQYPEIQKYVGDRVDQDYMQNPYRLLADEDMANIILEWIDYYEENIEQTVKNTLLLFNVAHGSLGGHEVMGEEWGDWNGRKPNLFTLETIRQGYDGNFTAAICHLFQQYGEFKGKNSTKRVYAYNKEYKGGASGLGIFVSWSLQFLESDYKDIDANCTNSFSFGIRAVCSKYSEYDIQER